VDFPATPIPTMSWRTGAAAAWGNGGSIYLRPNRLDVLVHLLAFEQLAGVAQPTVEFASIDWLARSEEFSRLDNDRGVAELASELLTSPVPELRVTFASGGQLVRGAAAAAASIYSGKPATRVDGNDKVIDRSAEALKDAGLATGEVRTLIHAWAARDPQAAVLFIDMDVPGAADATHELSCRYAVVHSEIDYLTPADTGSLGASSGGSVRVMCLRVDPTSFQGVLERRGATMSLLREGVLAARTLAVLWNPDRVVSSSSSHDRLLRQLRLRMFADQVRDRVFGR